jgi:hypothetical protein
MTSLFLYLPLRADAGAEVTGHRRPPPMEGDAVRAPGAE